MALSHRMEIAHAELAEHGRPGRRRPLDEPRRQRKAVNRRRPTRNVRHFVTPRAAFESGSLNERSVNPRGAFVVYWMTTARRTRWNFGLQRAVELRLELGKPLVILEALRTDYPWASDRLHQFILEGMADNGRERRRSRALYYPYVEPRPGARQGPARRARPSMPARSSPTGIRRIFLPRMLARRRAEPRSRSRRSTPTGSSRSPRRDGLSPPRGPTGPSSSESLPEHLSVPEETPLARLRGLPRCARCPPTIPGGGHAGPDAALLAGGPSRARGAPHRPRRPRRRR